MFTAKEIQTILTKPNHSSKTRIYSFVLNHLGITISRWKGMSKATKEEEKARVDDYVKRLLADENAREKFAEALNREIIINELKKGNEDVLLMAVMLLTNDERRVISMLYRQGMTMTETGRAIGISGKQRVQALAHSGLDKIIEKI